MVTKLAAVAFACSASTLLAALPELVSPPVVSSNTLIADDSTPYTVTMTIRDGDGYSNITEGRVLFNYTEAAGDPAKARGYLAWAQADSTITRYGGAWILNDATGGGRWGYLTDSWGGTTYITPISCQTSVSGASTGATGSRTITWTFTVKPAWAWTPLMNDADVYFGDASMARGWWDNANEFDVVAAACATYCATPKAPIIAQVTASTITLMLDPAESSSDLFAIRVSPGVGAKKWLQNDGRLGLTPLWQSRAKWGVRTVTNLIWNTTYSIDVRATRNTTGYCPSPFGPAAVATTLDATPAINSRQGASFNVWVRGQCPYRMISTTNYPILWNITAGSLARGLAGGLDADTYDWRDITSGANWGLGGGAYTTLQFLQYARDYQASPMLTANAFGGGYRDDANGGVFVCQVNNPEGLAADWVRYTNFILPNYRQGQESALTGENLRVYNSIANWAGKPKLLASTEAPVPPVQHWEIGNEPEVPGIHPMLNNHYLSPTDYRDRYKSIAAAMLAVDPTLKFGPCLTNPSDPNGQWLPTLAADPAARIDFISYHPYYSGIKYHWGNTPGMTEALRVMKDTLNDVSAAIRSIMTSKGRTSDYGLIASEWNPVNWDATSQMQVSQANALGVAETVFTFAEDGVQGGTFWEQPQSKLGPRLMFDALRDYMGDTLVANLQSFGLDPDNVNWRIYVTKNAGDNTHLFVWGLNFNDEETVHVDLSIPHCRIINSAVRRFGNPTGDTSLMTYSGMAWTQQPVIGLDPRRFTFTMQDAEATILVLEIAQVPKVDNDLDGDVDQADFGWFQACLTGPVTPVTAPDCQDAMLDADADADQYDVAIFANCFTGPDITADFRCAD